MAKRLAFIFALLISCSSLHATILDVLCDLQYRSEGSKSDHVLVLRQNRIVFEYKSADRSDDPCPEFDSYEISKSFIGLALALLWEEKKIPCFDVPVYHFFPFWDRDGYREITIRHLLNNTSGLDRCIPMPIECRDPVDSLLSAPILFKPGTHYQRNDRALSILLVIIKKETGKEFNEYLYEKLFGPIGVEAVSWRVVQNGSSLPHLVISSLDLAKVGVLIANKGMWGNQRIINECIIREMLAPSQCFDPFFGYQWWLEFYDIGAWWDTCLLDEYERAGISLEVVNRLRNMNGRVIHFEGLICGTTIKRLGSHDLFQIFGGKNLFDYFVKEVRCKGLPFARFKTGLAKAISARGRGGQQLIILPQQQIVGIRQKLVRNDTHGCIDEFEDFTYLLEALAKECDCYIDQ